MISNDEINEKITNILKQLLPPDTNVDIHLEMSLINDLSIDSIKVAELSILLEDSFSHPIFIPDLLASFRDPYEITVSALIDFVKEQLNG